MTNFWIAPELVSRRAPWHGGIPVLPEIPCAQWVAPLSPDLRPNAQSCARWDKKYPSPVANLHIALPVISSYYMELNELFGTNVLQSETEKQITSGSMHKENWDEGGSFRMPGDGDGPSTEACMPRGFRYDTKFSIQRDFYRIEKYSLLF